ncbi:helix-turn-helix domain-containing protein [Halalkalicoccus jeotgali]|uniref:Transposase n=1 Tax=Halalkalicoccus jeotgali (strain DSM 18796 / CECT 7217 / JCM 14584 / KCTC 4019 / B3) TaxID=795797 RepID=D8J3K9_HALJB|nr:helix-turn-helix domain-containing protein [Halalkalicoccus jeotgali]ADJ15316.1 Transposase and inactivated derivatives-like protein [Halalkalicoccus jeotgali B3]ELY35471.1 transposase [Halalkalicoccus jeotgali B3]
MGKLEDVSAADLREALATTENHKAVRRLMVALAYKDGDRVKHLCRLYGIPESTLYYWLDRFETRGLDGALEDEPRPGRPPKVDESTRNSLAADLTDSPAKFGYDRAKWTPELVKDHLEREYGVEYSLGHVRRVLRDR